MLPFFLKSTLCDVRMRSVASPSVTESPRASAFTRQPPWVTVHFHGNSKCLSWLKKPSFRSKTDTFYEKQLRYYFPWELLESNAKIKSCSYQNGNGFLFCDRFWDLAVGLNQAVDFSMNTILVLCMVIGLSFFQGSWLFLTATNKKFWIFRQCFNQNALHCP